MSMPKSTETLQEWLEFARSLALEAGRLEVEIFHHSVARRKRDGTLVTQADEQADALISRRIQERLPGHNVLSEEQTTTYDPSVEYTWVVDPLDGTTNYARGLLIWGVSIGLLRYGRPVLGVVHFPMLNELFTGLAGQGAWLNGQPIVTAPETQMDDQHLYTKCTRTHRYFHVDIPLKPRMLGSAAYHMLKVADGTALAGIESTPKVWDLAGAHIVVTEAGGQIRYLDGSRIFPLPGQALDYAARSKPVLAAANPILFQAVRAAIRPR